MAKNLEVKCFFGTHCIPNFVANTHSTAFTCYNLLFFLMLEQISDPGGDKTSPKDSSLNGIKIKYVQVDILYLCLWQEFLCEKRISVCNTAVRSLLVPVSSLTQCLWRMHIMAFPLRNQIILKYHGIKGMDSSPAYLCQNTPHVNSFLQQKLNKLSTIILTVWKRKSSYVHWVLLLSKALQLFWKKKSAIKNLS